MILIEPIRRILDAAQRLDAGELCAELWKDEHLQAVIVDLNTKRQLFDEGIRADGNSLPQYKPFTVSQKIVSGLPSDRMTLYQTGGFHRSFGVIPDAHGFWIEADSVKTDQSGASTDLAVRYGIEILGLTDQSKKVLGENAKPKFIELAKEKLYKP